MVGIAAGVASAGYFEERYGSRTWEWYRFLLADVVQHSKPGPILDVGAGHGLFTEAAARWGLDCVGLEGSRVGLDLARTRYPEIQMVHGLLDEPMPFDDGQFQTALMYQVIPALEPQVARYAVSEVFRVLRPGGAFFVASNSKAQRTADPTQVNRYAPSELAALLRSAGFTKLCPRNSPRFMHPSNKLLRGMMYGLFTLAPSDFLSATATFVAFKPMAPRSTADR